MLLLLLVPLPPEDGVLEPEACVLVRQDVREGYSVRPQCGGGLGHREDAKACMGTSCTHAGATGRWRRVKVKAPQTETASVKHFLAEAPRPDVPLVRKNSDSIARAVVLPPQGPPVSTILKTRGLSASA